MTDTITITGNLAAEPEQRVIPGGVTVTNFRVGSTQRRHDRASDQWVDSFTNWYAVSAFRALGEHAFASLHKGDRVIVQGRLRLREWDNGTRRGLAVEIEADALGHDLLWGVSTFQRARSSVESTPPAAAPTPSEPALPAQTETVVAPPALTDVDGWAIPAAVGAELVDNPF